MPERLSLVASDPAGGRRRVPPTDGDLALLGFLCSIHVIPLVAFAAGAAWGAGVVGYAAGVVFLTARELAREVALRLGADRSRSR